MGILSVITLEIQLDVLMQIKKNPRICNGMAEENLRGFTKGIYKNQGTFQKSSQKIIRKDVAETTLNKSPKDFPN